MSGPTKILSCTTIGSSSTVVSPSTEFLCEFGQSLILEVDLESIADDICGGETGISIKSCCTQGVVVIPNKPGTLVIGIEVLRLIWRSARIQHLIIQEADAMAAVWRPPGIWTTVANPGGRAAVKMD